MRILMTGSHGFVGTNLIEALGATYHIIRWDARGDRALPDCDVLIHLAGLAHDMKNVTNEEEYYKVNTDLTKKMFDAFLQSKAKKFIFFSSIKAQDNDTPYARSKKAAEEYIFEKLKILALQATKGRAENEKLKDKVTYILRPCMIHGKGVKGNLPLLFKFVKKGLPWPLAAFENKRSFASMGNVSYVVDQILMKDIESGIYNICDDEPVSTNELIEFICECLGKKALLWRVPQGLMKGVARVGDLLHLPLNSERLGKLTENYIVDNSEIKGALGIECLPVSAKEGLKESIGKMIKK